MSPYIPLIRQAVEYIEAHISESLSLERIAAECNLSEFYFSRMFSVIVGQSLGQYMLGRRLSIAAERLSATQDSIITIALDLGFDYPEVFSRAFKRQYGMSPTACRKSRPSLKSVEKARVIPRELVACRGSITLDADYDFRDPFSLEGVLIEADITDPRFDETMTRAAEGFLKDASCCEHLRQEDLYSLVKCCGDDGHRYHIFFGKRVETEDAAPRFQRRHISGGCYAAIAYSGEMSAVRHTFSDDLIRWVLIKGVTLRPEDFNMLVVFDRNYFEKQALKIHIPIVEPPR